MNFKGICLKQDFMKTNGNHSIHSEKGWDEYHNNKTFPGLTKREHFAAMAMQGFINTGHVRVDHKSGTVENLYNYAVIAKSCVDQADALIEALNK
jgi:hypothetical protein